MDTNFLIADFFSAVMGESACIKVMLLGHSALL